MEIMDKMSNVLVLSTAD